MSRLKAQDHCAAQALRRFKVQRFKVQSKFEDGSKLRSFQPFQTFNRFASFITGDDSFQMFQSFNRFTPFKSLRQFKVQSSVQSNTEEVCLGRLGEPFIHFFLVGEQLLDARALLHALEMRDDVGEA